MKNAYAIEYLTGTLSKTCDTIGQIALGINNAEQCEDRALVEAYKDMLLNLLENAQHSVIALTKLVTEITCKQEENEDGSAFMSGELEDYVGGEKNVEYPYAEEEEK